MKKPLSNVDEYLNRLPNVQMIRRGAYAWEPFVNGLSMERSDITIDGMHIFGACTDKMDPVTSYVELMNLKKIRVSNGQMGSAYGPTLAGTMNLELQQPNFGEKKMKGISFAGYETNNRQKIVGSGIDYTSPKAAILANITFRNASDYHAGGGKQIAHSQFTKYNASIYGRFKWDDQHQLQFNWIYDHADHVGYPALPMDVKLARAMIFSAGYISYHPWKGIHQWQTKLYYNDVKHIMDDIDRSNLDMHMTMPGWTHTAGFISQIMHIEGVHHWNIQANGYFNQSLAEMIMYSDSSGGNNMFMLMWPGVNIYNMDVFVQDSLLLNKNWYISFSGGITAQHQQVYDSRGFSELRIFYPNAKKSQMRWLKRGNITFNDVHEDWQIALNAGYGERAPSISEAYGIYLFNSFDKYDYIGNPFLKNERSINLFLNAQYRTKRLSFEWQMGLQKIKNYIIGLMDTTLTPMSKYAAGVRVYHQLPHATIWNSSASANVYITDEWIWNLSLSFSRGTSKAIGNLPFQQPLSYTSGISFFKNGYQVDLTAIGANRLRYFNKQYGETPVPAYIILNLSGSKEFHLQQHRCVLKLGIENILDRRYTTFANWDRIPQMGRNIFFNLIYYYSD
ncbi:MAG: TonB-dependent receptor plug domain-containing protein [Thermoflavifilum sp.]|nr:TonB-dependent receptor plug domain-containing protein [Thermoflavifilum sp.]